MNRDFYAQGGSNVASGLLGGIPVGGSVGQTAFNVMAGGRTRWAVVISGLWMLVFVVALGPLLSEVPIPALAGLLILAGFGSLKPRALARSWQTSKSSGAAALVTMVATLLVPIHIAVLIGVILTLLLVGINSASTTHIVTLEPVGPGRWRRGPVPSSLPPGQVTVLDVEGPGTFTSVPGLFEQLPQPPEAAPGAGGRQQDAGRRDPAPRPPAHQPDPGQGPRDLRRGNRRRGRHRSSCVGCNPRRSPSSGPPGCPRRSP